VDLDSLQKIYPLDIVQTYLLITTFYYLDHLKDLDIPMIFQECRFQETELTNGRQELRQLYPHHGLFFLTEKSVGKFAIPRTRLFFSNIALAIHVNAVM
jgi:hypothetical protein